MARGCTTVQVVNAFLVSGQLYSHRGLPLRGRGAYGPLLMHGLRVASLSLRGSEKYREAFLLVG